MAWNWGNTRIFRDEERGSCVAKCRLIRDSPQYKDEVYIVLYLFIFISTRWNVLVNRWPVCQFFICFQGDGMWQCWSQTTDTTLNHNGNALSGFEVWFQWTNRSRFLAQNVELGKMIWMTMGLAGLVSTFGFQLGEQFAPLASEDVRSCKAAVASTHTEVGDPTFHKVVGGSQTSFPCGEGFTASAADHCPTLKKRSALN